MSDDHSEVVPLLPIPNRTVKPTYGLTDDEVEKMLLDSVEHAKDDVQQRMVIEARTEGKQMVYTAENFIKKSAEYLSADEVEHTKSLIELLKSELPKGDKDSILKAIDQLNEYTKPFAERVMDIAVSHAMKGKKVDE